MIKIVLSFFLIFPFRLIAQVEFADTIPWSGELLVLDNFKGNYDTVVYNRQYGATTFWKVRYQYRPLLFQSGIDLVRTHGLMPKNRGLVPKTATIKRC